MALNPKHHGEGLLRWLRDHHSEGSIGPYLSDHELSEDEGRLLVDDLAGQLLVKDLSTSDAPDAWITARGIAWLERLDEARQDPGARVSTLRDRLLNWLDDQERAGTPPSDWTGFYSSRFAEHHDVPFTAAEVRREAEYLEERGLILAKESWSVGPAAMRPRLTASGRDCVSRCAGDVDQFLDRNRQVRYSTSHTATYNFGPNSGNLAVNNNDVVQHNNSGVDVAQLLEVARAVRELLPTSGLPPEKQDALAEELIELEEAAQEPLPHRGLLRRILVAVRAGLAEAIPSAVQAGIVESCSQAIAALSGG